MKLYEHEGKSLLRAMEIQIPRGDVASDPETAHKIAEGLAYPVVVKSQVLSGGRGKAGGIQFAPNRSELSDSVNQLLGMQIGEETVRQLLIEEQLSVVQEYYMGITVDPQTGMPMLMLSSAGGMEIESSARQSPETIVRQHLDPLQTYRPFHTLNLGLKA
ncbi:MAG: ATP-grasp domain-containing protein, partial [Desulfobacterales bacterium]